MMPGKLMHDLLLAVPAHLPGDQFTELGAGNKSAELIVDNDVSDEILLSGEIIDLSEAFSLLFLILIPQQVKADGELVPGDDQVVLGIQFEALQPLSHVLQLEPVLLVHLKLDVLAIGIKHNRLFGLVFAHNFDVIDVYAVDASSYNLRMFLVKYSELHHSVRDRHQVNHPHMFIED